VGLLKQSAPDTIIFPSGYTDLLTRPYQCEIVSQLLHEEPLLFESLKLIFEIRFHLEAVAAAALLSPFFLCPDCEESLLSLICRLVF